MTNCSVFFTSPDFSDHVPGVPGPSEEHDLPLRARDLPDVRRPHVRVPHLPQDRRAPHPPLLIGEWTHNHRTTL